MDRKPPVDLHVQNTLCLVTIWKILTFLHFLPPLDNILQVWQIEQLIDVSIQLPRYWLREREVFAHRRLDKMTPPKPPLKPSASQLATSLGKVESAMNRVTVWDFVSLWRETKRRGRKNKLQTRSVCVCVYFFASACVAQSLSLQDRLNVTMPVTVSISMLVKPFIIFLLSCELLSASSKSSSYHFSVFLSLFSLSVACFSRRSPCSWWSTFILSSCMLITSEREKSSRSFWARLYGASAFATFMCRFRLARSANGSAGCNFMWLDEMTRGRRPLYTETRPQKTS